MPVVWVVVGLAVILIATVLLIYVYLGTRAMLQRRPSDAEDTPRAYGLSYEEVTFRSRDGLLLYGNLIPVLEAEYRGTIVFCHGQAGSMNRDVAWVPPFHEAGFNVLMFDFRGHGRSEGEIVSLGHFERLDLLGAIDFLEQRGIERVGVIGFSMGGAVAISTAKETPNIAAVVSDSGYASLQRVLVGASLERGIPYKLAQMTATLILKYANMRLKTDLSAHEPRRKVHADFDCPLLAIQGNEDPYVPVSDIEDLVQQAGGHAELWSVAGVGHRETREQCPEDYRQRVLAFFARWLTGEAG